ncbi:BnaA05g31000D [Brassica napus]|uniref:BnaA05g31000D protein n=1 Tax=Brassica napus TaxID=3708 RepID=A0A078GH57_BRANA|nr:BnaA05g31000D [Brassica napus]
MNINRDEALRAQALAEALMQKSDFTAARKLAIKAHSMDSTLENISHMTMVCDVHCAAAEKTFGNNEMDWYGILQVDVNANEAVIKKQYRKLALLLHPDKNKLPGAESAFKLIGEAQRILLDKDMRMLHDVKRRTRPAPAPRVPSYRAQQASVNMRNVFNGVRPQGQPPHGFAPRPTFWTSCPFCGSRYEYGREHVKREVACQTCKKLFTAFEVSFPTQQNMFPGQRACAEPHKRPVDTKNVPSGKKAAAASTAENNNEKRKRKRKDMDEPSESSESESSSDSEDDKDDDTMAAGNNMGSNGGQEPRRSVRSKRQVSYNENVSDDDDVDLVNDVGEGENVDTEKVDEDHHHQSTEALNPKEKIQVSLDDSEDEESSLGGEAAAEEEANVINCEDPEFSDFDKLREKSCFSERQVWALYDEGEGMPRFYAVIKKVTKPRFSVKYVWLEPDETRDLPVSVGRYVLGDEGKTSSCDLFSHLVQSKTRSNAKNFTVFPGKGETWALFKNWDMEEEEDSDSPREYEFVEILSDHEEGGDADTFEIPPHELFRFSHRVPSFRLKGTEGRGVLEGWFELDPAALPVPGSQDHHQSPP